MKKPTFIKEDEGVVCCTVFHHQGHLTKLSYKTKLYVNPSVNISENPLCLYLIPIIG